MKKYIFILLLAIIPFLAIEAQGNSGGRGGGRGDSPGVPPAIPIDGGLSVLLIAGGIYGAKKLRDYNRKE